MSVLADFALAEALLPSEHQLMAEFAMARPTVVKALSVLRDQGWIVTHQGKGRFVRGRPAIPTGQQVRAGRELLDRKEVQVSSRLLSAEEVPAPNRIASYLGIKPKAPVVLRRFLVEHDNEPTEISSTWLPVSTAQGTALAGSEELKQGVRRYVEAATRTALDHIVEHITARNPTKEECAPARRQELGCAVDRLRRRLRRDGQALGRGRIRASRGPSRA
ncbi:GntR family transcriptional regulator [Nonomuraea basaltis]|uniref:GntR family transcriptional regulator n=1 Tax=Nonomuraea basaltis TaxID=2495887 RepID=UPI00110C652B|nr:GntR family transcriptional regulator [Nonomuraea basaltis]TMR98888.1 GntR family transcriptional regulator [Nonomuraea basaltis]